MALDAAIERSLRRSSYRSVADLTGTRLPGASKPAADQGLLAVQKAYAAASAAADEGRFEAAETIFREALRLNSDNPWAWDYLGDLLADSLGRFPEAEDAYRTAVRLDPSAPWPWIDLGRLLTDHLDRHTEAEEAFRTTINLESEHCMGVVRVRSPAYRSPRPACRV